MDAIPKMPTGWRLIRDDEPMPSANAKAYRGTPPGEPQLLEEFGDYLVGLKKSSRTVEEYVRDVRQWMGWWEREPATFQQKDWDSYTNALVARGCTGKTIRRYQASLKRFFKYLRRVKRCQHDPGAEAEPIKVSNKIPEVLTKEEVDAMLGVCRSVRYRTMFELMYSCGLRNAEVRFLPLAHVGADHLRIKGKGDKERLVPLMPRTKAAIEEWMPLRGVQDSPLLFPTSNGAAMSDCTLGRAVSLIAKRAGITRGIHPHTFRHSIATHLVNAGMPMGLIKEFLGHESVATTEHYARLAQGALSATLHNFHPAWGGVQQ